MLGLKKLLAGLSTGMVVLTSTISPLVYGAGTFDKDFSDALSWMNSNNLTKYSTEESFMPYRTLTREQASKFFVEFSKNSLGKTVPESSDCYFYDLNKADYSLKTSILEACKLGIINGYNGMYYPKSQFTKAQAITVLIRALYGKMDEDTSPWFYNYYQKAYELGLTKETNPSALNRSVLRGEMALLLYRASQLDAATSDTTTDNSGDDLGDVLSDLLNGGTGVSTGTTSTTTGMVDNTTNTNTNTNTSNVVTNGNFEISLSPSTPASTLIPSVGTVTFGKYDVRAGNSDVTISSIRVYREGLGQRNDIQRVWIERNGVRVTSRQSVGTDNSVWLIFSPALVVKANTTSTLDLVASLNGNSTNSQHRFTIRYASDIEASSSIAGTFPISTNYMSTTSYNVASVGFSVGGSSSTYNVGTKNVEIGQFKLQNNAGSDMGVIFKSIILRNEGNGDMSKNLSNLGIYRNGSLISNAVRIDGKYVTFTISNDRIQFGRQENYYIRADLNSVDNTIGDTYQFSLRYSDDISVVEESSQFQVRVTGVDGTITMPSYSVKGGDIVLSRNTSYSSSQTISPGTNDVVLWSSNISISQPVTLGDLSVSLNNNSSYSGTLANLANSFSMLKLKVGNNIVSTFTPSSSSSNSFVFEGSFPLSYNTTIQILGNSRSNAAGKYLINEIAYSNFGTKEYSYNGNTIQSTQFVGSVGGIVTSVGSADLMWTRNDGLANQSLVVGARDRTLIQFVARANDVSDVNVSKLKFVLGSNTSNDFNTSYITNLRLYANNQLVSSKNMYAGNADFNDINVRVPRNSDVTFRVEGDFSTSVGLGQKFQIALSGVGLVEARDSNGVSFSEDPQLQGAVYTFTNAGATTVSLNSSSPSSKLLTPSSNEVEVARYTFSATEDSLRLTDLYMYNAGTADLPSRIRSIGVYDNNGNKLAGGSILGTGVIAFSLGSTSNFIIPKNSSNSVLIIKAALNDVVSSTQDYNTLQLGIGTGSFNVTTVDGTINGVRLVSESIGNTVSNVVLSNPVSNSHLLVRSKPSVATSYSATYSTHTIAVTADSTNRIMLTGLVVNVSTPSGGPQSYTVYKDSEAAGNVVANGTFTNGTLTIDFPVGVEISAGSTRNFIIVVSNMAGTPAVNSKRIVRVIDMKYVDLMDIGSNNYITSVSNYSNVGLPSAESIFTY